MLKILKWIPSKLLYNLSGHSALQEFLRDNYGEIMAAHIRDKELLLFNYKAFYRNLYPQKSREWLEQRLGSEHKPPTVGGSEVATLLGNNPYSKIKDFYMSKLEMTSFEGNEATRWGNFFEEAVTKIVERDYKTKVWEFGSIPGIKDGEFCIQTYSPDGLFIFEDKIVLMEIKSPYNREPNGQIPSHYLDQIQIGLHTVKIADYALFFDALFRVSTIEDLNLNNNRYDGRITRSHLDKNLSPKVFGLPRDIGYIFIYKKSSSIRANVKNFIVKAAPHMNTLDDILEITNDIGIYQAFVRQYLCKKKGLELDLKHIDFPPYNKCDYIGASSEVCLLNGEDPVEFLFEKVRTYLVNDIKLIAVIPWKLFNLSVCRVDKDPGYLELVEPKIKQAIRNIFNLKKQKISKDEFLEKKLWETSSSS